MGRKMGEICAILFTLLFFGVLMTNFAYAAEQAVFVEIKPERPNATDGKFWEGEAKLELRIRNYELGIKKLYYTWDELKFDQKIEYKEPFAPIEGEHWLYAWGEDENGQFVNPATRFWMQYRKVPLSTPTPRMEQVSVSSERFMYGEESLGGESKGGRITEEAATTAKIAGESVTPTPVQTANFSNKFLDFVSERPGIWAGFLLIGIVLFVVVRFGFRR